MSEYLYMMGAPKETYFIHSGVKGMHWHVRKYQYEDGRLTPLGKIHYAAMRQSASKKERSLAKQKASEEAAKKKAEEEKKRKEENKERILREGSATDILPYVNELSNAELKNVAERINFRNQLNALSEKEKKTAVKEMDKIMNKIKKVNDWTTIGINSAKNVKQIVELIQAMNNARERQNAA